MADMNTAFQIDILKEESEVLSLPFALGELGHVHTSYQLPNRPSQRGPMTVQKTPCAQFGIPHS